MTRIGAVMKKIKLVIVCLLAAFVLVMATGVNISRAELLFDRGLPVYNSDPPNLNLAAQENRCNVAPFWSSTTYPTTSYQIGGDDFIIGSTGQQYHIETVRIWVSFGQTPPAMDTSYAMELWGGPEGGLGLASSTYTATNVFYPNTANESYQRVSTGTWTNIWQIDFTVDANLEGGQKYYFFVNGLFWSNSDNIYKSSAIHSSNASLSNSTQQGADDIFLWLTMQWDGSQWVPGAITEQHSINIYGTSKGIDANIQILGSQVPAPSTLLLLGSGLLGLAAYGRRFWQ